jgi:hypothetical protein
MNGIHAGIDALQQQFFRRNRSNAGKMPVEYY